jgi:hypothetical protein
MGAGLAQALEDLLSASDSFGPSAQVTARPAARSTIRETASKRRMEKALWQGLQFRFALLCPKRAAATTV